MEYSEDFKREVREAYPYNKTIHNMLDEDNLLLELQLLVKHAEFRQRYKECKTIDEASEIRDELLKKHACLKRFRREYGSFITESV